MIDAHLHLQDPRLLSEADTIVETCREVGISRLIVNGTRPDDWSIVTELAERFPEVHASFGLHPWYVNEAPTGWEALLEDCLHQGAVGVGEIGLDLRPSQRLLFGRDDHVLGAADQPRRTLQSALQPPQQTKSVAASTTALTFLAPCREDHHEVVAHKELR